MVRQSDATRPDRGCGAAVSALLAAALMALAACSQSAGAGAARAGTRLGAAELGPSERQRAPAAPAASPALELLDRHETFAFNRGAAEIVDYHAPSRHVFVVDSGAARVRVLELGASGFGGGERVLEPARDIARSEEHDAQEFDTREVTSLAVGGDLVAVTVPAARNDRPGLVVFYAAFDLQYLGSVSVGFGPDMLTFTPDARRILVANEGEQVRNAEERIIADPEGSVSIIDLRDGVQRPLVSHARFDRFDGRVEEYRAAGVRIGRLGDRFFESGEGKVRLSRDLEPEYIAVAPDGQSAWVSLQENDAVAKLDIESASFVDIFPLGVKDFSMGQPRLAQVPLPSPADPGDTPAAARAVQPMTGLCYAPGESRGGHDVMYVLRGTRLERLELTPERAWSTGVNELDRRLDRGQLLHGLARDERDGSFWLGDAARPILYRVDRDGRLLAEVPLPGVEHGGVEHGGVAALAWEATRHQLLVFTAATARWSRVLVIDGDPERSSFGEPIAEHVYPLGGGAGAQPVAVAVVEPGRLVVTERSADGQTDMLYRVDLTGAGDVRASGLGRPAPDPVALEVLLAARSLAPAHKRAAFGVSNPVAAGGSAGLALLPGGRLALLGGAALSLLPGRRDTRQAAPAAVLGLVSFDGSPGLDASDRDGSARIGCWPVLGAYMPDGIAALRAGGEEYFITANEGDTRGYDAERLRDLELDPQRFPDAVDLQSSAGLGRLKVSTLDGDLDGDGDLDEVHAFGARSLSLWDRFGRLVFDTGALFEEVTARALREAFNSNNDDNGSFDSRSDDRGPEPEGLAVAEIEGRSYAFVGLERVGGIVVLDVTDPSNVRFVEYDNPRDFAGDPRRGAARDLGPEGLKFVPASSSPTGRGLLLVANEVSGTTTAYDVNL
jgi:choice-of-anchor I-like protein/phytase-like protein